jgi:excisionase family DNA binding protein
MNSPQPSADAEVKPPQQRAYSIKEFCCRYNVGRTKVYKEIAAGRLHAVKVGRRTLIRKDDAEAWLAALPALITPMHPWGAET